MPLCRECGSEEAEVSMFYLKPVSTESIYERKENGVVVETVQMGNWCNTNMHIEMNIRGGPVMNACAKCAAILAKKREDYIGYLTEGEAKLYAKARKPDHPSHKLIKSGVVVVKSTREDAQLNDDERYNEQLNFLRLSSNKGLQELVNSLEAEEDLKNHKHRLWLEIFPRQMEPGGKQQLKLLNEMRPALSGIIHQILPHEHFAMIANQHTKSDRGEYTERLVQDKNMQTEKLHVVNKIEDHPLSFKLVNMFVRGPELRNNQVLYIIMLIQFRPDTNNISTLLSLIGTPH